MVLFNKYYLIVNMHFILLFCVYVYTFTFMDLVDTFIKSVRLYLGYI